MSSDRDDDTIIELIAAGFLVALGAGLVYRVVRAIAGYSAGDRITHSEAQQLPAGGEEEEDDGDEVRCHECGTTEGVKECSKCNDSYCSKHSWSGYCSSICYDNDNYYND